MPAVRVDEERGVEDLERLVRVERNDRLRDPPEVAVDEVAETPVVVQGPGRERPATKSSKSGVQNVFCASTTSRHTRVLSRADGRTSCSTAHDHASAKRASYSTFHTSPTRSGRTWGRSGSGPAMRPTLPPAELVDVPEGGARVGAYLARRASGSLRSWARSASP